MFALFIITTISFLRSLCNPNANFLMGRLCLGFIICIGEPIALAIFIFGITLLRIKATDRDFYMVDALARASSMIDGILESFPQLIIQSYNNNQLDN